MPHTIRVTPAATLQFVGTFRETTISPSQVISVKVLYGQFIELKHDGGKFLMPHQFTGFHRFVNELRRANPSVTLRGV